MSGKRFLNHLLPEHRTSFCYTTHKNWILFYKTLKSHLIGNLKKYLNFKKNTKNRLNVFLNMKNVRFYIKWSYKLKESILLVFYNFLLTFLNPIENIFGKLNEITKGTKPMNETKLRKL